METSKETPKRYNPLTVTIHWLVFILLFVANALSEGEGRRSPINIHMYLGAVILTLMVIRLVMRFATRRPNWADTGNKFLNWLGEVVHWALYIVIFMILGGGAWLASSSNRIGYLLGTGSAALTRGALAPNIIHRVSWFLIILLLGLHVAGALYHQFILKDNLMGRMWYGKR